MKKKPAKPGSGLKWLHEHKDYSGDFCLLWPFGRTEGYGTFGAGGSGKLKYAHRYMCELVHGPAPTPKHQAAHECGNGGGGCVNPKHLKWKTPSENMCDKTAHGTQTPGPKGKITIEQAREIQALRGKMKQRDIAEMFGISRSNVGYIQNKTWRGNYAGERMRQRPTN